MDNNYSFKRENGLDSDKPVSFIGSGSSGGKAQGLLSISERLAKLLDDNIFTDFHIQIPVFTVIRTNVFDRFMHSNKLHEIAFSNLPDERIAHAFIEASLPFEVVGDLKALIDKIHTPLAIRSSSMLEDALYEPFAGVYTTKMIPNNQHDADNRFRKLVEAIKLVYASTYFKNAQNYIRATRHDPKEEKMAVIIQEVIGKRYKDTFYPQLSGVARTYNYYAMGRTKPQDGVVNLAFGLGKTIVDGGISWSYSPAYPNIGPPFASINDMLKQTQTTFWSVNMGKEPAYNPVRETEYMVSNNINDAEDDKSLKYVGSTIEKHSGRLAIGTGAEGARILNFAPILQMDDYPVNAIIKTILKHSEEEFKAPVEIEFAVSFDQNEVKPRHRFGFLQVRPMVVPSESVEIDEDTFNDENVLIKTRSALGNGVNDNLLDIVFVKPEIFDAKHTPKIAMELEQINNQMLSLKRKYLLMGFGRWGSSDPWLGIPVQWSQISQAQIIVEAAIHNMNVELSQGAHFFHNLSGFGVSYFSIPFADSSNIDWQWLNKQNLVKDEQFVRHIHLNEPLLVKVDGQSGQGVILKKKNNGKS